MAVVTGLRAAPRGQVAVELDGGPWRTLPGDVVVRAGLTEGSTLDRPGLRKLRRELRSHEALAAAVKILSRREHSAGSLGERLARAGVAPAARAAATETLTRAGFVSDTDMAVRRAQELARRGRGDGAVRAALVAERLDPVLVSAALDTLEPEVERARAVVAARGPSPRTVRYLARNGFADESIAGALPPAIAEEW